MSSTKTNPTTSNISDEMDAENYRLMQGLSEALEDMTKCIDKVIDMRVEGAELELELASQHCPEVDAKLRTCHKLAEKSERLMASASDQQ